MPISQPAADEAARGEPGQRLARLGGEPAGAFAEAGDETRHEHVRLRAVDAEDVDLPQGFLEGAAARGQLAHAGVGCHQRALRLGALDDDGEGVRRFVAEGGDVDHVGGERLAAQVALLQQGIGAAKGEDGGVAVVRGDQHRGPGRSAAVAQGPARRHALLHQVAQHRLGARVLAELDEGTNVEPQPRHRHGGVDGAAADVRGHLQRLGLAPLLEQQEGVVGVGHAHALDAVAGDDGDRIDHGAADGEGLHGCLAISRGCAMATPRNSSSSSGSHSRMPPVMPAVLLTMRTCGGTSMASLRALPPPM